MQGYIKVNRQIIVIDGLAERGKAGLSMMPSLLFELRKWWHSPYINHFVSADTVVSSYANPQSLNRYGYVLNNPIRYNDPTGRWADEGCGTGGPGGGTGCNLPPVPPPSGTTGQHTGTHSNNGGNTIPPIVVVPPVDVGPVVLPDTSLDPPELNVCKSLEHQYFGALSKIRDLAEKIKALMTELRNTTDPEREEEIKQEIDSLYGHQLSLVKKLDGIRATAKALGCNTVGWP